MTHAPESGAAMPPTEGRDTLRERAACAGWSALNSSLAGRIPWHEHPLVVRQTWERVVDAILAEIETAGYRIVGADASCFEPVTDEVLMPGFDPDAYDLEAEQ
jgi:hypothetical protein